jgi:hypothetical protein
MLDRLHRGPFAPRPGADHDHVKLIASHGAIIRHCPKLVEGGSARVLQSPSMPGIDYAALRAHVRIEDVLRLANFRASEALGVQLRGPCPIHGSQSPTSRSFSVHVDKNTFRCFKCGASGNQLDLWVAISKLSLHEAARDLCERLGIDPPEVRNW